MSYRAIPVIHASSRRQMQSRNSLELYRQEKNSLFKAKTNSFSLTLDQTPLYFSCVRCQKRETAVRSIYRGLKCQFYTRPGYQAPSGAGLDPAWIPSYFPPCWLYRKWIEKKNKFYEHPVSFPVTFSTWNFEECGEPAVASFHRSGVLSQGIANGKWMNSRDSADLTSFLI